MHPVLLNELRVWWPVIAGLLWMYSFTLYDLMTGLWSTEDYAHSPIILGLALWLIATRFSSLQKTNANQNGAFIGWPIFVIGLALYVVGRSQSILMLETISFVVIATAIFLIFRGVSALGLVWFPLFFMLFAVPLPGPVVAALTLPMKIAVSYVAEHILFWLHYPIARSGVILQVGAYQLMVADACAGLQTLLTLEALGLFYLNVVQNTSALRNMTLAALIIPISFTANVIRVITLTLVTYHFGDAAGQGFLHGFAGLVLFITALIMIICADYFLRTLTKLKYH